MSQAAPGITVRAGVRAPSSRRHIRRLGTPATSRPVPPPSAPGRGSPHPAADPRLLACKQPSPRRGSRSALPAAVSQMNRPDRRPLERPARERQPRLRREPSVASLTPFFGRKTSRSRYAVCRESNVLVLHPGCPSPSNDAVPEPATRPLNPVFVDDLPLPARATRVYVVALTPNGASRRNPRRRSSRACTPRGSLPRCASRLPAR